MNKGVAPSYYMPGEKVAYRRGYREGLAGSEKGRSQWPNAYSRGYWEGVAARPNGPQLTLVTLALEPEPFKACTGVAVRYGQDQYRCGKCGVLWDTDEDRPRCEHTDTKDTSK